MREVTRLVLEAARFQMAEEAFMTWGDGPADTSRWKRTENWGALYRNAEEALCEGFLAGYKAKNDAANGGSHAAFKSGYQAAEDEQANDEHRAWKKDTSASGGSDLSTLQAHVTPGTTRGYKMDGRRRQQRIGAVAAVAPAPVPR